MLRKPLAVGWITARRRVTFRFRLVEGANDYEGVMAYRDLAASERRFLEANPGPGLYFSVRRCRPHIRFSRRKWSATAIRKAEREGRGMAAFLNSGE